MRCSLLLTLSVFPYFLFPVFASIERVKGFGLLTPHLNMQASRHVFSLACSGEASAPPPQPCFHFVTARFWILYKTLL